MTAYYNEIDAFAAEWLRNLISSGHIAPGDVDTRSIEDVLPSDLAGYTQCHFFAGIGVWSYALRLSGWPDARPVWTGSCPCQPFSAAGKGTGTADQRHLWPAWFHLIEQCRPATIFGEQVESAIRHGWLDLVQADLEGVGYACGAAVLPAAGFGAPHIRHRLWFVANNEGDGRREEHANHRRMYARDCQEWFPTGLESGCGAIGWVANVHDTRSQGRSERRVGSYERASGESSVVGGLGIPNHAGRSTRSQAPEATRYGDSSGTADRDEHGPTNGFWADADWLHCKDGKWRPTQPGIFPLAHGPSQRVGRLRAYGNAIVSPVAEAFIRSYLG